MYENKGHDNKMYPKLMLNILKVMGGLTLILYPIGDLVQGSFYVCID
jgi:hypothetical protein